MKPTERPPFKLFFAHHFRHLPGRECAMYDEKSGKYFIEKHYARNRIFFALIMAAVLPFAPITGSLIFQFLEDLVFLKLLAVLLFSALTYGVFLLLYALRYFVIQFSMIKNVSENPKPYGFLDYLLFAYSDYSYRKETKKGYTLFENGLADLFVDTRSFRVYDMFECEKPPKLIVLMIIYIPYFLSLFFIWLWNIPVFLLMLCLSAYLLFILAVPLPFAFFQWKKQRYEVVEGIDIRDMAFKAPQKEEPLVQKIKNNNLP